VRSRYLSRYSTRAEYDSAIDVMEEIPQDLAITRHWVARIRQGLHGDPGRLQPEQLRLGQRTEDAPGTGLPADADCPPDVRLQPHFSRSFQALRAEVHDDGGMRRVIGWLRAAITLIIGSANAALRQLGRRSANAAPAAAVAARVQLVDSETRRS
jgi:hypothetical protein